MQNIIKFIKKYYIFEILVISGILFLFWLFFYAKLGTFLIDTGREVYIPSQMIKGKLLYKDLFNVYGPLAYQINALLFKFFGEYLNTLYFAGFINSLIICITSFFIVKFFSSRLLAVLITLFIMIVCIFSPFQFNFIFPYAYSVVYGISAFLISFLALLHYFDKKNTRVCGHEMGFLSCGMDLSQTRREEGEYREYSTDEQQSMTKIQPHREMCHLVSTRPNCLLLSFFFAGVAFTSKYEFIFYIFFLFSLFFFIKLPKKTILYSTLLFGLTPFASVFALLVQGVGIKDLLEAAGLICKLASSPILKYYFNVLAFTPTVKNILVIFLTGLAPAILYAAVLSVFYFYQLAVEKFVKSFLLKIVLQVLFLKLFIFTLVKTYPLFTKINTNIFISTGQLILALFAGFSCYFIYKYIKNKNDFNKIEKGDLLFYLLLFCSILATVKYILSNGMQAYGPYPLSTFFMPVFIFLYAYVPRVCSLINKKAWQISVYCFLSFLILNITHLNLDLSAVLHQYPLQTKKGVIFVDEETYKIYSDILIFLEHNTQKTDKVLILPEGGMVNFMAQRPTYDKYYYLIAPNIYVFGEKNIVSDLQKDPPEYVIINFVDNRCFGHKKMCETFGFELCNFIHKNYEVQRQFVSENEVQTVLLKRKILKSSG